MPAYGFAVAPNRKRVYFNVRSVRREVKRDEVCVQGAVSPIAGERKGACSLGERLCCPKPEDMELTFSAIHGLFGKQQGLCSTGIQEKMLPCAGRRATQIPQELLPPILCVSRKNGA